MKTVLFINPKIKECGVYQYGFRIGNILKKSNVNNYVYLEIESVNEYESYVKQYSPYAIIYNNIGPIMPWLSRELIESKSNIIHIGFFHEGASHSQYNYKYLINVAEVNNDYDNIFSSPRPLVEDDSIVKINPDIITINSFGFSFGDKGFKRVIDIVCSQFDEAIINLHIPSAHYDRPKEETERVLKECPEAITKEKIKLNITRNFISEKEILNFLSSSTINFFPYDEHLGRGLSSVIDLALSVDKPIAISKSYMFRHIFNTTPSICIEDRKLIDIINNGTEPLKKYKEAWSNQNLIKKYDYIIGVIK
jgi:hypothetical protein